MHCKEVLSFFLNWKSQLIVLLLDYSHQALLTTLVECIKRIKTSDVNKTETKEILKHDENIRWHRYENNVVQL